MPKNDPFTAPHLSNSMAEVPRTQARGKKLIYHLMRMSRSEHTEFRFWLVSPLHSNSPQFADFLDILLKEMATGAEAVPAFKLHAAIPAHAEQAKVSVGEDKVRDKYLGVRLSRMMQELRKFLTWKQLSTDSLAGQPLLLQALCDRECDKYLGHPSSQSRKIPLPNLAARLRGQLGIQVSLVEYASAKGASNRPLHSLHSTLDDLFLLEKVKYACADLFSEAPESNPEKSPLLAAAIEEMRRREKENSLGDIPSAYFHAFQMLSHLDTESGPAEQHFQKFRQLFKDNRNWAREDAMDLFVHGHNYCILQFQRGKTQFIEDIRDLYDEILAAGHPLQKGVLPYQFYKNAVEVMCKLKDYDWAEKFTEEFQPQLSEEHKAQMYAYNKAIVSFFRMDYKAVVSELYQEIGNLAPLQVGMGARVYLCRALWKTNEQVWLLSQLQAFEQHLRRNRDLQDAERNRYKGFVRYLKGASQAVTGPPQKTEQGLKSLLKTINEKEPPLLYRWLRQELEARISR